MAKAARRAPGNLIVLQSPRRAPGRRRAAVGRVARRAGRRAAGAARSAAVPTAALAASAGLGYAQAKGYLNKLPTIGGSRALTIAIAGFALSRFTKNATLRAVGSTAMLIGAFDWGSKTGGGKSALEGDGWFEGDDSDVAWDESDV